jgi:hypothetical protein
VTPLQAGSAFVPLIGVDLELLLSVQHARTVTNDSVVSFESVSLQLPRRSDRAHYVRCPVLGHEFPEGTLGISYQGRLLARYTRNGALVATPPAPPVTQRTGRHAATARRPAFAAPIGTAGAVVSAASPTLARRVQPARTLAPRAAGRPTPGGTTTCAGAAVHSVDGATTNPRHSATHATPTHRAVHTVDSRFTQRPASKVRAVRTIHQKRRKHRRQISR